MHSILTPPHTPDAGICKVYSVTPIAAATVNQLRFHEICGSLHPLLAQLQNPGTETRTESLCSCDAVWSCTHNMPVFGECFHRYPECVLHSSPFSLSPEPRHSHMLFVPVKEVSMWSTQSIDAQRHTIVGQICCQSTVICAELHACTRKLSRMLRAAVIKYECFR